MVARPARVTHLIDPDSNLEEDPIQVSLIALVEYNRALWD
jgi:hypothetical protein